LAKANAAEGIAPKDNETPTVEEDKAGMGA
jgi:hypothetical protein